nr:abscission/NoCut checkpoint regulator isoform X1 [Helicoverpa armigera]
MSCNSCAKPFSLLRKEKGCPSCGFSYCSKCLENKMFVERLNTEAKVCAKCKNNSSKPNEPKSIEAPDAYYRRVGAITENQGANTGVNTNMTDLQILERLKKLKEDSKVTPKSTDEEIKNRLQNIRGEIPTTSDAEIYSRLAKLKGMPVETVAAKPVLPPPDTRTEQEQADDLLKQYMEQTNIDTKYQDEFDSLVHDIETRITKLKGTTPTKPVDNPQTEDSDDEETTVKKILEKIKIEDSPNDEIPPSDELPFCEICNEDARMRCLGCQYLFCKRCFMEHKDDDDGCNRYVPYEAPKSH